MSTNRFSVLLVDDEPRVLDGLRRQLRIHRERWDIRFANSGEIAIAMLAAQPADIVVSDMRMPGVSGGQLLREVRHLYPQTTRMILSGQTDQEDLLQYLGCIHHYLQKPCEAWVLCAAIERTHLLFERLRQPRLQIAANRVIALPPSNEVYNALVEELGKPQADVNRVAEIVSRDPALTAKLMQLVNSAFFGVPQTTNTAQDAVILLGLRTINSLVVTARIFDFVDGANQNEAISALWQASLRIGDSAGRLAFAAGANAVIQQQARLSGILSLVGRAILITSEPDVHKNLLRTSETTGVPLGLLEQQEFGATQDEVAAYALGQWAFADEVVEAVAWQSLPSSAIGTGVPKLLHYLHLARSKHRPSANGLDEPPALDRDFIKKMNRTDNARRIESSVA